MATKIPVQKLKRIEIHITGLVQGVGFRPAVYRYAIENDLTGHILNTVKGVTIELQGTESDLDQFVMQLKSAPPAAARIESFETTGLKSDLREKDFQILFSEDSASSKSAGISPDLATCPDCINDIFDKENRRFNYPFTNCTNCGPRFTIINDRPYDRPLTSMREFPMCNECKEEYKNPLNRRFHAQPNACAHCGPELRLIQKGNGIEFRIKALIESLALLKSAHIGAIKGLGGFHFACDPFEQSALNRLREKKNRPNKSFALMMKDIDEIKKYCILGDEEKKALLHSSSPIVLLKKKNRLLQHVSPDNNYLGVFLPYTPLHHLLMQEISCLIMTSANRRDEPLAIHDSEIEKFMDSDFIDFILTHNREIIHRCDDSIIQFHGGEQQFIRRSRGFVPNPIRIKSSYASNSLSFGANMKNTFALRSDDKVFISQHIGDLVDYNNLLYQETEIQEFSHLLDIEIDEKRCDAHPSYENYNDEHRQVYHHHAHMLSVMAEYDLNDSDVIGVICDGTGYGSDGAIWGFEFLQNDSSNNSFTRLAHLDYFPIPGGEIAIREIDRIAIAISENRSDLPFDIDRIESISQLIESGINTPRTSSLGRLFDGIAALTGLTNYAEYEARGAILLQRKAELIETPPSDSYSVNIHESGELHTIDYKKLVLEIGKDISSGKSVTEISWKFHKWIAESIVSVLQKFPKKNVILSGGCFQNILLINMVKDELIKLHYKYYTNTIVPPNDGGIALGQAYF